MLWKRTIVALSFTLAMSVHSFASNIDQEATQWVKTVVEERASILTNPSESINGIDTSGVGTIETNENGSVVTGTYKIGSPGSNILSFSVKSPFNSANGDFSNVDGISNKTAISLDWKRSSLNLTAAASEYMIHAATVCKEFGDLLDTLRPTDDENSALLLALQSSAEICEFSKDSMVQLIEDKKSKEIPLFNEKQLVELAAILSRNVSPDLDDLFGSTTYWGITGEYSKPSLRFLETLGADAQSKTLDQYKLTGTYSLHNISKDQLFRFSVATGKSFGTTRPRNICGTVDESLGFLECFTAIVGTPSVSKPESLTLEFRQGFGNIATAFKFERSFGDKRNDKISIPVWLSTASNSTTLRPGLRIDWNDSLDEKTTFALFLGIFNLF